jgi:Asp-tRNA(Asn)/Glu-tRNA(Gln) amidotransferase A subunit family amidase
MPEPCELTACDALELMRARKLSAVELLASCLRRIDALEDKIGAWTYIDRDGAVASAKAIDDSGATGALRGIPIGVKDVIDTADMPTRYGSPIFEGWRPRTDAACVAIAREEGAVIVGKTVTQAFACGTTVKTANPLNIMHTSGGSSSGSVAAVAAKMVPLAFGTQSASSLIRPASYTGLVGMRPSFGLLSVAGFKYFNGSFDTIGLLGRSVDDVELLWTSQLGAAFTRGTRPARALKIGICRPPWLDRASPAAHEAIDKAERVFAQAGATVSEIVLPESYAGLVEAHEKTQEFEAARSYAHEYRHNREQLDVRVRGILERGYQLPVETYIELLARAQAARAGFPSVIGDFDCIVTAAAPDEAPKGWHALGEKFEFMGDTSQSRAWTLLHVPQITVPCHRGPNGLPIGIQLITRYGADRALLHMARWAEDVLAEQPVRAVA